MSAVANVAVNLDSRGVPAKLKQIQQASSNLDRSFKGLKGSADQVKSAIQAQQGGFAKASTVQSVFSARVLNTEKAIRAQIAALREVQSTVKFNGALYQKASQQIKQYEGVLRNVNKEEERGIGIKQRAGKALSGLRGTLLSIGAGAAISTSFGDAQALALAQKRLARLTEEYGQFAGAQQEAERLANKFEVSVTETSGALSNLGSRLGAQGVTLEEIVAVYEGMNSALIATGRSAAEASSASYQLAQALGSGSLTGDELKTISETLPELLNAVAAAAGKSSTEIRAMAKEGALSADLIIQATKTLRDKYEGDVAANITQTQKFRNALGGLSEAIGTELAPSITVLLEGATEMLKLFGKLPGPVKTLTAAALGLTAAFVALAPAISAVIGLIGSATLIAAAPWVAAAAGVAALTIATVNYYQEQAKLNALLDDGAGSTEQLKNKQSELEQKLAKAKGELQGTGGEMAATGRKAARLRDEVAELQNQLNRIEGTYEIRLNLIRKGYTFDEKGNVATFEVSGVKYNAKTRAAINPPPTVSEQREAKRSGDGDGAGGAAARGAGAAAAKNNEAKRTQERISGLQQDVALNEKLRGIREKIAEADLAGDQALAVKLRGEERLVQLVDSYDRLKAKATPAERDALEAKLQSEALLGQQDVLAQLNKLDSDKAKAFEDQLRPLEEQRRLLEAQMNGRREEEELIIQIENATRGLGDAEAQRVKQLIRGNAELEKQAKQPNLIRDLSAQVKQLQDELNPVKLATETITNGAFAIGDAFSQAFTDVISGAKSTEEALADTFESIGKAFLEMAAQIIAKQLTMIILQTILKALGGGFSFAGGSAEAGLDAANQMGGVGQLNAGMFGRASGGPVKPGNTYMVGERGPELLTMTPSGGYVTSNSASQAAMDRYSSGNTRGGSISVNYNVTEINGMKFVTEDQFRAGISQAAKQGAEGGFNRTMASLKNSRSTRSRVGV